MINVGEVLKIANEYDVITFDVFDTLIIRDVQKPADIFTLAYGKIGRYFRVGAEMLARMKSRNGEVTLKNIEKYFFTSCEKELQIELDYCRANPKIFEVYKSLKECGKKLYAISDMYLPSKFISELLEKAGYDLELMVSCEEGCNKYSGELFQKFLANKNVDVTKVLHIGDNILSDYSGAKKVGIKSYLIEKHTNKLSYVKYRINKPMLSAFINHGINELQDPVEKIGYEIVGPIILGFCQWVHENLTILNFNKAFFLARDMRFVYDIYKKIYHDNVSYLCVSRKSLEFAKDNPEEICKYLKVKGCYGNVAVVDTGWVGLAQVKIAQYAKMIEVSSDVGGLYLGTKYSFRYCERSQRSKGCYFISKFKQFECGILSSFLEALIGTIEPQVIRYENSHPIFDREESGIYLNSLKKGALKFIDDWSNLKNNSKIDLSIPEQAFKKLFYFPKWKHILLLENLIYEDIKSTPIINFNKNINYFCHPIIFINDLSDSGWKGGFLKKCGILYPFLLALYTVVGNIRMHYNDINKIKREGLYKY